MSICQKTQKVPKKTVKSRPSATHAFECIHLDLFYFDGNTFFKEVDAYSKFIDVKSLRKTCTESVLERLDEIYTNFGFPKEVCSDNGPPFNSSGFIEACKANNIKVLKSPPYHPQSNRLAERGVQTIKKVLKKYLIDKRLKQIPLQEKINKILFNYRNTPYTSTDKTPSSLLFSYVSRTLLNTSKPVKLSIQNDKRCVTILPKTYCIHNAYTNCIHKQASPTHTYSRGDKVFYRNHMEEYVRWIPAVVLDKISPNTYLINLQGNGSNKSDSVF